MNTVSFNERPRQGEALQQAAKAFRQRVMEDKKDKKDNYLLINC